MNNFNFVGRLVKDPLDQSKKGKNSYSLSRITIALDAYRKDEKTADFISCMAWGNTADFINAFAVKGSRMALTGHVQSGHYEDENGSTVFTTDFVVDRAELLDTKDETEALVESNKKSRKTSKKRPTAKKRPAREPADEDDFDDQLPWDDEDE